MRRSIDEFFVISKFPNQIVLLAFELENSRAHPDYFNTVPIGLIYKSDSRDSLLRKRASKRPANFLEPHGPSMYSLSMIDT